MKRIFAFLCVLGAFALSGVAFAATTDNQVGASVGATMTAASVTQNINVTVYPRAYLTLSGDVTINDSDPVANATLTASVNLQGGIRLRHSNNATLTITAGAASFTATPTSGSTLNASDVSVSIAAAGSGNTVSGYSSGSSALDTTAVSLGTFANSGTLNANVTLSLANSWSLDAATYTLPVTYTLTAP
jgi:hypothetical protein